MKQHEWVLPMLFGSYVPDDWDERFLVLGKEKERAWIMLGMALLGILLLVLFGFPLFNGPEQVGFWMIMLSLGACCAVI